MSNWQLTTDTIYTNPAKQTFKASSPLHRNQGERAYKVIGIRRPQKLQQICGRDEEYKEHVTFLIHTY
jgi:hypothetical protein